MKPVNNMSIKTFNGTRNNYLLRSLVYDGFFLNRSRELLIKKVWVLQPDKLHSFGRRRRFHYDIRLMNLKIKVNPIIIITMQYSYGYFFVLSIMMRIITPPLILHANRLTLMFICNKKAINIRSF